MKSSAKQDAFRPLPQMGLVECAVICMLFGLSPHDPGTMAIVVTVMIGMGVAAAIVPARRAARVDPLIALRYQ